MSLTHGQYGSAKLDNGRIGACLLNAPDEIYLGEILKPS